jgi:hypothetical protein
VGVQENGLAKGSPVRGSALQHVFHRHHHPRRLQRPAGQGPLPEVRRTPHADGGRVRGGDVKIRSEHEVTSTVRDGVRVTVHRSKDGTAVEAACQCFGMPFRTHSTEACPRFRAAEKARLSAGAVTMQTK